MTRTRDPLFPIALIFLVAAGILLLFGQLAHADPVAPAPVPVAIDWQIWIALGIAALAGVRAIVDTLLAFFKAEAPLTKTTVDDRIRDDLQLAHDKLDSVLRVVGGLVPATGVPTPPRDPQAGKSTLSAMLVVVALLGVAAILASCATGKAALAEGTVAFLECEGVHVDAKLESDLKLYAESLPRKWLAGGVANLDAIKADVAPIKSDALRCLVAGALAAATALVSPTPGTAISALSSTTVAPAAVRAQFEIGARLAGWPAVKLPGGEVL